MGELVANTSIADVIWNQANYHIISTKNIQENNWKTTASLPGSLRKNYAQTTIVGYRNGVPEGQDQNILLLQKQELRPYVKGMHPHHGDDYMDLSMARFTTNPIAGTGGYDPNLVSRAGDPLAFAIEDVNGGIIGERMYDSDYNRDPKNPLSAAFAINAYIQEAQRFGPVNHAIAQHGMMKPHMHHREKHYSLGHFYDEHRQNENNEWAQMGKIVRKNGLRMRPHITPAQQASNFAQYVEHSITPGIEITSGPKFGPHSAKGTKTHTPPMFGNDTHAEVRNGTHAEVRKDTKNLRRKVNNSTTIHDEV